MTDSLQLTMLPAKEGDCLMVAYGDEADTKYILIDAGRSWTYKHALKHYLAGNAITELELLVITHVDRDHIDGVLELIRDPDLNLDVKNVWFNTWDHLNGQKIESTAAEHDLEDFGAKMGEELSAEIVAKGWRWNRPFDGGAVILDSENTGNLIRLGDVTLTLLSPDRVKLLALIPDWRKECQKAGITPGYTVEDYVATDDDLEEFGAIDIDQLADEAFSHDNSDANGSSIAFILEYKKKKLLLSGDAHPNLLVSRIEQLGASKSAPMVLDAFKLPHHGSKYNISKELLDIITCDHYLVSTNGNYFKHPDRVAMARLIKYGSSHATIDFNYKTDYTRIWENAAWQSTYGYQTRYPGNDQDGYLHLKWVVG